MKYLICLILTMVLCTQAHALELTEYEFENLDIIHTELEKKFNKFQGLHGTKNDMKVIGVDEKSAKKEIDKMNIPDLVNNKPHKIYRKNLVNKLKQQGFTNQDLKAWGFKNSEIE